ncbi:MAG: hypothetical protein WAX07_07925 [Candidatus Altiarchaeia archaeon]
MKNTRFLLIATAIFLLFSCGCTLKPKTAEQAQKEDAITARTTPASGCERPYAKIGDECCRDENDNRVCDLDESGETLETLPEEERTTTLKVSPTTTSLPASSTSTSQAPSTSTTAPGIANATTTTQAPANASNQCALNADCGTAYYGSCICSNSNVVQTKYIPMCLNGVCKWRSKSETINCRRVAESSDEAKSNASERCVIGYGRCITNGEYDAFLTADDDTTIIDKVSMDSFSKAYKGYSFRNKKAAYYAGESRCYENVYFMVEVKNPAGETSEIEITWNRYSTTGAIKAKVGGVVKDDNGKDNPVIWVKEA